MIQCTFFPRSSIASDSLPEKYRHSYLFPFQRPLNKRWLLREAISPKIWHSRESMARIKSSTGIDSRPKLWLKVINWWGKKDHNSLGRSTCHNCGRSSPEEILSITRKRPKSTVRLVHCEPTEDVSYVAMAISIPRGRGPLDCSAKNRGFCLRRIL